MHFEVEAKSPQDFYAWLGQVARRRKALTPESYIELSKQSIVQEPFTFKTASEGLFEKILDQTLPPGPGPSPRPTGHRGDHLGCAEGELDVRQADLGAIPFDQPIPLVAGAFVVVVMLGVLAFITIKGWIPYLWREWITSVDHKRIGVMYVTLAPVMLLRGFIDAIMMRSQQAIAFQSQGYLPPEHYNQIFSAHGTIMIFFVAMPFVIGLMNFVVPLQLGVRDVAFPTLNSVSFWLTATGALLVNISLVVGEFARTGWLPYPPLSELTYSPGVGVDYYLWGVQISGVGTLMTGINFVTTILKMHAPGMTYMRMPVFCWTALASNLLIVAAFPILTATLAMLTLDRYLGFHFFTNEAGGNVMMFMNLIWAWGHPEVYILMLPAFGVFSEVVSTFSRKPLFGYRSMVMATMAICVISFMVWLHHFFTMGAGPNVNAIFGIASMIIAVPTGVKIYNWLFTMYGGRVVYATPMLWSIGFMVTFIIGGLTGVLVAVPPADFMLHNSLFLVAHFHNVIIGGVLFGDVRRLHLLVPEGVRLPPARGLGQGRLLVLVRRLLRRLHSALCRGPYGHDAANAALRRAGMASLAAGRGIRRCVLLAGIVCQVAQLVVSIRDREELRDVTGDPWDGRSLEWSTSSPPPVFNFAVLPHVEGEDDYWRIKQRAPRARQVRAPSRTTSEIEMPRNSATGFVCAFFATIMGFGMIWHIWWLVVVGAGRRFRHLRRLRLARPDRI